MSDIVLSKKQQKKALRTKKANKQTVKNVLAIPEQAFWPLLKEDDVDTIHKALEANLPKVRHEKVPVKYKEIANLSKEDRKTYRANLIKDQDGDNSEKKNVAFGVNHVDKLVCLNQVSSVLVSADVSPRMIVEGLFQDCAAKEVILLVIPDLRRILKQFCGISSVVFAIKTNDDTESKIYNLEKIIKALAKEYLPKTPPSIDAILPKTKTLEDVTKKKDVDKVLDVNEVYLYRKSKNQRMFDGNVEIMAVEEPTLKRKFDSDSELSRRTDGDGILAMYRPLTVKRFRNDPNRQKKKNN